MAVVYLPVRPELNMTSAERAEALNREVFRLIRPTSVRHPMDVTEFMYLDWPNESTGQHALIADTEDLIYIDPAVDLTLLLALMPEVPQQEKDQLVAFIDANRGQHIPFGYLIPSTSEQLTETEAIDAGWRSISNP